MFATQLNTLTRFKRFPKLFIPSATQSKQQLRSHRFLSSSSSIFQKYPPNVGLYNKDQEKDSCGVGLVAHLKKNSSRKIVVDANEMLVRMSHRGGCGCEPNSGDGAGNRRDSLIVLLIFNNVFSFFSVLLDLGIFCLLS
jgi:hypothetical protein